jgi:O-antigen/teichoic acid export membrane protein
VSRATAAALCVFLLGMPSSLSAKLLGGYQEVQIANIVSVLASLVSLVLIVSLVMCHAGLVALVVATSGAVVGINVLSLVWIWLYHKPWLLPKLYHLDRDAAQRLMRTGWDFFILQISGIIVFNTDNLIVTHYLGPAQVAPYSVTWRLVGYSAILQMLITPALWPAYSEAFVRGDMVWIRKTFWRIFRLTMGTSLGFVIILGFEGRWLIRMGEQSGGASRKPASGNVRLDSHKYLYE